MYHEKTQHLTSNTVLSLQKQEQVDQYLLLHNFEILFPYRFVLCMLSYLTTFVKMGPFLLNHHLPYVKAFSD
jgi:hypothetical protein